jgi:hypothetical protein
MIRRLKLHRWKRFEDLVVDLGGHAVLVGPNNAGKTTVLQAIASWSLALRRWRATNNRSRPGGVYPFAYIARPDFLSVPVPQNAMDLLWWNRETGDDVVIVVEAVAGWQIAMEFEYDQEQIRVRPRQDTDTEVLRTVDLDAVYVPPMGGLAPLEPQYADDALLEARLGEGRPGEVLRNMLLRASRNEASWSMIQDAVRRLFGYSLDVPRSGAYLVAEYRERGSTRFDLGSAGAGFQQVLMLLTFLAVRPGGVLLVDEPDAHLHLILQDAIFHELTRIAARRGSQLIVSTHSEVIVNSVAASDLLLMPSARRLQDKGDQSLVARSLGILSNSDLMLAAQTPGVLYLEGPTDLAILRAFAEVLAHPVRELLTTRLFWHRYSDQTRDGAPGFSSRQHFSALQIYFPALRGIEIQDRDGNPNLPETGVTGHGLQLLRWRRYEMESYLLHPEAIVRFVTTHVGAGGAAGVRAKMGELLTSDYVNAPDKPNRPAEAVMESDKARTKLLPPILDAGGVLSMPYTQYDEIAAQMLPSEIHPEVKEKLDAICTAFGIPLSQSPATGSVP